MYVKGRGKMIIYVCLTDIGILYISNIMYDIVIVCPRVNMRSVEISTRQNATIDH